MNITILGAGAMGSLWACYLAKAGHKLSLWQRSPENSAQTMYLDDEQTPFSFSVNNEAFLRQSDLLLITVKAWQIKEAIKPVLNKLHPDTILLFMHNGMGAVDEIALQIDSFPVVLATTTQAAFKPEKALVRHTGRGQTQLGAFNKKGGQCAFLAEVLNHALPDTLWNPDIQAALWNKLAINCAINPLTAIEQCKNGKLAENSYAQKLESIIQEVALVMNQEGVATSFSQLKESVYSVIHATKENYSSMQQDIFYQRRTEIDFITGYLCKSAGKHGIAIPENQNLYNEIKRIEKNWRTL